MSLVVFSNEAARPMDTPYITCDKQGRIYMNRLSQKELGTENMPASVYVAYDAPNKTIGLIREDLISLPNVKPFRFNGDRAYASAISFMKLNRILPLDNADRYVYVGKRHDGWHLFTLDAFAAPDHAVLKKDDAPKGQTDIDDYLNGNVEDPAPTDVPHVKTDAELEALEAKLNETQRKVLNAKREGINLTNKAIGDALGLDKSTVSKTLKYLRELGFKDIETPPQN